MAVRKMSYQYETSPRKLEPNYRIKNKSSKVTTAKKISIPKKKTRNIKNSKEIKIYVYIFITFAVFLAISYRNTLINQEFSEIQKMKENAQEITKENEQLEMGIQNSINLNNMEDAAKLLGMQKLNNSQKVYIQLEKKDYIEPSAEEIVIKDSSWIDTIINKIKSIF